MREKGMILVHQADSAVFGFRVRDLLAGNIMMWARGISEFGAIIILTYYPMTAPTLIYQRFETLGLSYSQPVAAILIIVCVIAFIVLRWLAYRGARHD